MRSFQHPPLLPHSRDNYNICYWWQRFEFRIFSLRCRILSHSSHYSPIILRLAAALIAKRLSHGGCDPCYWPPPISTPSSNLVPTPHHCENIDTKAIGLTPKYEAILLRLRRQIVGGCWTWCKVVSRIVWSGGWLRNRDDMKMIR